MYCETGKFIRFALVLRCRGETMTGKSNQLFLKRKPVRALLAIKAAEETYCSEVSKEIDSTYSHTVNIVAKMKEMGLLECRESGRKNMLKLTARGEEQADLLRRLMDTYEEERVFLGRRLQDNKISP